MRNYQRIPKKIKCPVCGTNDAHQLWQTNSIQAARHFVMQEKYPERFSELVSHIEYLWGQKICEVVQCDKCGFCYSNPYIAGDERFYTLAYDKGGYPTWKWELQLTYDFLKKNTKPDFKLLEIGAGDGAFIKRIAEDIFPKENIFCTEFSKYGTHQIKKFGINCVSEDIRDLSNVELEGNFDIVCMFQVLEHMDRLDVLFQKLNWLMKRGGSLFIAVPNPIWIEFNELNGALLDMPPNHIGRWNKQCFDEIAKMNGFFLEDYKVEESSFLFWAKQFVIYRYLQKPQQNGSLENQFEKIKNKYLRRVVQMIGISITLIFTIPTFTKKNSKMSVSQFIHLIKTMD